MAGTRRRGHSVEATAGLTGPVGGGWEGRGYGWDAQGVDGFGSGGDLDGVEGGLVDHEDRRAYRAGQVGGVAGGSA